MLSEEEKKAIKVLEINPEIIEDLDKELLLKMFEFEEDCSIQSLKKWANNVILNLITRLEKENKNSINKDIIRDKINERQFELQQEYKDFEDDIRLNTLQELYYYESKEE